MPTSTERRSSGFTIPELAISMGIVVIIFAAIFLFFRLASGQGRSQVGMNTGQSAFTQLAEWLQRDLAGKLPSVPVRSVDRLEIRRTSPPLQITYQFDAPLGTVWRTQEGSASQRFTISPEGGRPKPVQVDIASTEDAEQFSLTLKVVPNASQPDQVFDRRLLFRAGKNSSAFFQGDTPLPAP